MKTRRWLVGVASAGLLAFCGWIPPATPAFAAVAPVATQALPGTALARPATGSRPATGNSVTDPPAPGVYSPLTPRRICDTRPGNPSRLSGHSAQCNSKTIAAGKTLSIDVAPDFVPSGASEAVLSVTAIDPSAAGSLTIYPAGVARPAEASLDYAASKVVANLVEVALPRSGADAGKVSIYSRAKTNLTVDLEGYVAVASNLGSGGGLYNALPTPTRICETSPGNPSKLSGDAKLCDGKTIAAGRTLTIDVAPDFVPSSASAVVLDVTTIGPSAAGSLTVYPAGVARPGTTNVDYSKSQTVPCRVIVALGRGGKISIYSQAKTNVAVDLFGYYSGSGGTGEVFAAESAPVRISAGQTIGAGKALTVEVSPSFAPTSASAAVVNVTASGSSAATTLSVYPGTSRPNTSDLDPAKGETEANLAVTALAGSTTRSFTIYNRAGRVKVTVDLEGYYEPISSAITTAVSATAVAVGTTVVDTATVKGDPAGGDPKGTYAFYLCAPATPGPCAPAAAALQGSGSLRPGSTTDTATATSSSFVPGAAGTWCFSAVYSGSATYAGSSDNTTAANEATSTECFTATSESLQPSSTSARASSSSISLGSSLTDSATVTGDATGGDPGGTVDFYVCPVTTAGPCPTATGTLFGSETLSPDTSPADTSSTTSIQYTPSSAGEYCLSAVYLGSSSYSGSADNTTAENEDTADECFSVAPAIAAPLTWTDIGSAEPPEESWSSISCPTTSFCAAVSGQSGDVAVYQSGEWSSSDHLDDEAEGSGTVSCTSSSLCLALIDSSLFGWDGTTWSTISPPSGSGTPDAAVCTAGTAFCMLFADDGDTYTTSDGSTWAAATALPSGVYPLDATCLSATSCLMISEVSSESSTVYSWDGSAWTAGGSLPSGDSPSSFSCSSATVCLSEAFDTSTSSDLLELYDGSTWSTSSLPSGYTINSAVSCVLSGGCFAMGEDQSTPAAGFFEYSSGTWSAVTDGTSGSFPGFAQSLACAGSSFCEAGGGNELSTFSGTAWSLASVGWNAQIEADSCASASFCVAVDNLGNYTVYNGTSWTTPAATGASGFSGLDVLTCPANNDCEAVDNAGDVWTYDGTDWTETAASIAPGFNAGLSCLADGFCAVAGGEDVATYDTTTSSWTTDAVDPTNADLDSVSCLSTTFCIAVDASGYYTTWNGSTWAVMSQFDTHAPTNEESVSCLSTDLCVAVGGNDGYAYTFNGTAWTSSGQLANGSGLESVSCVPNPSSGPDYCVASSYDEVFYLEDQSGTPVWSSAQSLPTNNGDSILGMGCASSICVATGFENYAWEGVPGSASPSDETAAGTDPAGTRAITTRWGGGVPARLDLVAGRT